MTPSDQTELLDDVLKSDLASDAYDTGYISPTAYPAFKRAVEAYVAAAEQRARIDEQWKIEELAASKFISVEDAITIRRNELLAELEQSLQKGQE